MRRTGPVRAWRALVAMAVASAGLSAELSFGQVPDTMAPSPATAPAYPAGASRIPVTAGRGPMGGVRRVQATPGEAPAPPAPGTTETPAPARGTSDLSAPAAERSFGGGEPTEAGAAEETAAPGGGGEQEAELGEAPPTEVKEAKVPPTLLMKLLGMEDSPVKIYGWIQNSFTGNPNQPSNRLNFGVNPNFKANQWMGNQYYLIVENPLEQEDHVNFGFRVDNLFGNDWQFNKMYGLYDNAFRNGQFTGYDTAQMYGEVHLPILTRGGLDVKGGRWYGLHGYEVVPAIGRPLLSVPYMFNYGQPFTHFGMISTLHVTDKLNVYNGTTNGWDRWINQRYRWGYIGGWSWTFGEGDKGNWTTIFSTGPNQFPQDVRPNQVVIPTGTGPGNIGFGSNPLYNHNWRQLVTTVVSWKWTAKLTQVIETDQGWERRIPGLRGVAPNGISLARSASWYSFGNWFLYSFADKWTGVWRSEVFWDPEGARTGFADAFHEMTLGLIWKPTPYTWIRPEARYDWSQFTRPYSTTDGKFTNSQFTLGFDVIFLY